MCLKRCCIVPEALLEDLFQTCGDFRMRSLVLQDVSRFAPTSHALRNLERVAVATSLNEPVLLVGETGTGKTTLVQQIAKQV